ncbi:DUF58 domain-containing protein [Gillisia sp. Hel_I_29]|uniref:DUF58 domain-containing protein n=1 Tax=Gillisia sp. Hel_I_29 TaxID=1249975 RepID=UPI00054F198E|nr:DUF58 domain-containing protein [Gillisia sp. Hel_I_29]
MKKGLEQNVNELNDAFNLELLAKQIVEGFVSGMHKSPFHGFSAEFAEHKLYNNGESTKHIDWKLYAKTDKLYTKRFEEETNLRCHLVIDNSSSMHYPKVNGFKRDNLNKINFSILAAAALMQILKRQRDAVGLSIYSDTFEFYAPEKGGERHRHMLLNKLEGVVNTPIKNRQTKSYTYLHQIAEKLKRRSLVFIFTDMFQEDKNAAELFEALKHLTYNKHEIVLFHVIDKQHELDFNFDDAPKRFVDVESGDHIDLYSQNFKDSYHEITKNYFKFLQLQCAKYKIKYVLVDVKENFEKILTTYLVERQKFKG